MSRLLFFSLLIPLVSFAQSRQKVIYNFNQCILSEKSLSQPDIQIDNPAICHCGLEQDCIELNNQGLTLPLSFDTFFYADFSFGFSLLIEGGTGNLDVLSKMRNCNNDTSMSVVYQSKDSLFVCNFTQGFDKIVQLEAKADPKTCWQQLMITRSAGQFRLYINGILKAEENDNFIVRLNSAYPVRFNKSPCIFVSRLRARLDQIILSNFAMIASEVASEYIPQDEIITQDTLIFAGANFELRARSDCASTIQWTPATGLSNAFILQPIASPLQQTRYFLRTNQAFCKTEDSVLIKVIDTSNIDCSGLKLPTAFSPNQDRINDQIFISNNYIIEKLSYFDIYDRSGSLIVRFTNPQDSWDGRWNGNPLQPGTYYYRILYTCKEKEYATKGSFFLMR